MANNSTLSTIPVIAIDGPSASGKGTVAQLVAEKLNFHYFDSGALYRIVAFVAYKNDIEWNDAEMLGELAKNLKIQFSQNEIYLDGERITEDVRSEEMSSGASQVAIHPQVRNALLDLQRSFRKAPGLVGDGRDMGSVIFKDAVLKIFLTASVQIRAERRYKQLINKGLNADYAQILADLQSRDERDSWRSAAPLIQTADALLLETSKCSIEEAVKLVLNAYQNSNKKP